uniref:Uncharacterized protein n=1 Tax=Sarcophilus harrisii TaxID=9305 RepID=A0A7N4Q189_SARHA
MLEKKSFSIFMPKLTKHDSRNQGPDSKSRLLNFICTVKLLSVHSNSFNANKFKCYKLIYKLYQILI